MHRGVHAHCREQGGMVMAVILWHLPSCHSGTSDQIGDMRAGEGSIRDPSRVERAPRTLRRRSSASLARSRAPCHLMTSFSDIVPTSSSRSASRGLDVANTAEVQMDSVHVQLQHACAACPCVV